LIGSEGRSGKWSEARVLSPLAAGYI
jgi:hypothetical protein